MSESALLDALTHHRIGLERYSASLVEKIQKHLRAVERDLQKEIAGRVSKMDAGEVSSKRMRSLLAAIREINQEAHKALRPDLFDGLHQAARYEADWTSEAYSRAFQLRATMQTPSAPVLRSIVTSKPFQGRFLKDWASGLEAGTLDRIEQQILIGMTEGEGTDDIIRRLRGTRAGGFKDGVFATNRRSAEMVTRTAVNHVSNAAHATTLEENKSLFPHYRWISVLDGRTSPICRERSGKVYKTGEGPIPPGHPNCRSTVVGVPRGSSTEAREELDYATWLEQQPADVQREILGPTRYQLYKDGGIKIDKFVADGQMVTLDRLKAMDESAFKRAGLLPRAKADEAPPPSVRVSRMSKDQVFDELGMTREQLMRDHSETIAAEIRRQVDEELEKRGITLARQSRPDVRSEVEVRKSIYRGNSEEAAMNHIGFGPPSFDDTPAGKAIRAEQDQLMREAFEPGVDRAEMDARHKEISARYADAEKAYNERRFSFISERETIIRDAAQRAERAIEERARARLTDRLEGASGVQWDSRDRPEPLTSLNADQIAEFAIKHPLPRENRDNSAPIRGLVSELGLPLEARRVDRETFERSEGVLIWRGFQKPEQKKTYATPQNTWMGRGVFGDGDYFAAGDNAAAEASGYGDYLRRAKLSPNAKVINSDELGEMLRQSYKADPSSWSRVKEILEDPGRAETFSVVTREGGAAAFAGYDAIYVDNADYYVILNRGMIVLEEEDDR